MTALRLRNAAALLKLNARHAPGEKIDNGKTLLIVAVESNAGAGGQNIVVVVIQITLYIHWLESTFVPLAVTF